MARAADTYTAPQAAKILDVSERRVRQLVAEGKLDGERDGEGVMRVSQRSVNEERKRRRATKKAAAPRKQGASRAARSAVDVDQIADKVASAVGQRLEGQLEITRQAESLVRSELDEERARRMEAEARLGALEAELAATENALESAEQSLETARERIAEMETSLSKKRGLFRR
jgi:excisionase family DNA binding protein